LPAPNLETDPMSKPPWKMRRLSDGSPIALKLLYSTHPDTGLHDYVVLDRPITALLEEHGYPSTQAPHCAVTRKLYVAAFGSLFAACRGIILDELIKLRKPDPIGSISYLDSDI